MAALDNLPVWILALIIFGLRIVDQSIGTVRTITVVQGRIPLSMALGFCEVTVWVVAISHVISRVGDSPFLVLAYAAGFATGNAIGIAIERRVGLGACVTRLISPHAGAEIAATLRDGGQALTTFDGEGRDGPVTMVLVTCPRRQLPGLLATARAIDPDVFYAVETARDWRGELQRQSSTGWRGVLLRR